MTEITASEVLPKESESLSDNTLKTTKIKDKETKIPKTRQKVDKNQAKDNKNNTNSNASNNKQKQKGLKNIPHKDQYQRMSFLYQAANAMTVDPSTEILGRLYAKTMKATAQKSVLRL